MKLYSVNGIINNDVICGTLKEARKAAMEEARMVGEPVEIEECEVVPMTKQNILNILNSYGGSWVAESRVIWTVQPPKKK